MQVCPVDAIRIYELKDNKEHCFMRRWKKFW
jgi:hypothetical protein